MEDDDDCQEHEMKTIRELIWTILLPAATFKCCFVLCRPSNGEYVNKWTFRTSIEDADEEGEELEAVSSEELFKLNWKWQFVGYEKGKVFYYVSSLSVLVVPLLSPVLGRWGGGLPI